MKKKKIEALSRSLSTILTRVAGLGLEPKTIEAEVEAATLLSPHCNRQTV